MIDIVETDYGRVRLSHKTLRWLNSISPEWRDIVTNKRRRGKRAEFVRNMVNRLEITVSVSAAIALNAHDDLTEF